MHTQSFSHDTLLEIQNAELKQEARDNVSGFMGEFAPQDTPSIFTLPGVTLEYERQLHTRFSGKLRLEGVERDEVFYAMACRRNAELGLGINLHNTSDHKYWRDYDPVEFDGIYLDYCGQLSREDRASVDLICRRKFLKFRSYRNPRLYLTVKEGREERAMRLPLLRQTIDRLGHNATNKHLTARIAGFAGLLNDITQAHGLTLQPGRVFRYRDRSRNHYAKPMLLFSFEILPEIKAFDYYHIPVRNVVHSDDSTPYL